MPFRIVIFSPRAAEMERLLLSDSRFHPLDAVDLGAGAFHILLSPKPDGVILDDVLPGLNPLHLCRRMEQALAAPPRVLYLGNAPEMALDVSLPKDAGEPAMKEGLNALLLSTVPALSRAAHPIRKEHTKALLSSLSMPPSLKGAAYIAHALPLLSCQPDPGRYLGKPLYAHLSQYFQTSSGAAERALRTAIEATWLKGDLSAISSLFGYTTSPDKGKPTNSEFLSLLARHVQSRTQHTLDASLTERTQFYGSVSSHYAR